MSSGLRYFAGALAFGFAAVWIMATLAGAVVCVLAAAVAYGVVVLAERTRAKRAIRAGSHEISTPSPAPPRVRTSEVQGLPQWADTLNSDLGHVYEPAAATSPLAREAEYGWPLNEDTVVTSSTGR